MGSSGRIRRFLLGNLDNPSLLSRKNELSYKTAVLFLSFALPYAPLFIFLGLHLSAVIVILSMAIFFASIFLNRLKFFNLSKVILIFGAATGFFTCANILTSGSGAQLLLFTLIPLPFLIFDVNNVVRHVTDKKAKNKYVYRQSPYRVSR